MALTKVNDRMIDGAPINALNYGADPTGTSDSYAAIQAAIDAVEATGKPGVVSIPSGTYLCNTGLTVDASLVSIKGDNCFIKFENIGVNDFAITISADGQGYAGGSYYAGTNYIEGLRIKGREGASEGAFPLTGSEVNGILIEKDSTNVFFGYEIRNCVITNFTIASQLGGEAWGITFENCNFIFNQTGFYAPSGLAASGAKILFDSCIFTNGKTAFNLNNVNGTTFVTNCNIEAQTDNFFYANAGELMISDCHIEQASDHTASYFVRRDSSVNAGVYAHVYISNTFILAKGTRTKPIFDLSNPITMTVVGGQIFTDAATYAGAHFETDASLTGVGTFNIFGTYITRAVGQTLFDLDEGIDGSYFLNNINVGNEVSFLYGPTNTPTSTSNNRTLTAYDEGVWTPTAVSLTTTGSPTYSGTYTRIGNRVFGTLTIDANGGTTASTANTTRFTGLPYAIKSGAGFACSTVTSTTVDQGSGRVEGSSVYSPTWSADSLVRYITFQYEV